MSFVEFRFLWFFLIVFIVYWTIRGNSARKVWLLVCSYAFYAAWNWKFTFLVLGSTTVDYIVGLMLGRSENPAWRRFWIATSVCVNLGVLAFFKYFNFFISSASGFLAWLGLPASVNTLNIILPVGISFYTFHSMSYTIDVYRGKQRPISNFVDLSLFVSFFPPLVAGPIVRAVYFLPQLVSAKKFSNVDVRGAVILFLAGFIKKACIADGVASTVTATLLIRRISRQRARGLVCCSTPSRFTAIFPATQTWLLLRPGCLGTNYRTTFSFPTLPGTSLISGGAGTLVFQVGFAIISTFRLAVIAARAGLLTVMS